MGKFDQFIEKTVNTTNLTRVRLKCDPLVAADNDLAQLIGYEGYILSEDNGQVTVYVTKDDTNQLVTVPQTMIDVIQNLSKTDKLKLITLKYITEKPEIPDSLPDIIKKCSNVDTMIAFLKDNGFGDSDLVEIFKRHYNAI